AGQQFWWLA
ncbi:acylphosphatase, partial [Escherichia coli 0.1288]